MKIKSTHLTLLAVALFVLASCGQKSNETHETNEPQSEESTKPEAVEEPASKLGNFETLLGNWTVDAATAGLQMDISFTEDGKFHQKMGELSEQSGTWEIVDEQHIKVVTPSTKGQTWLVTNLSNEGVSICWNPDSDDPKTIPFQRAE